MTLLHSPRVALGALALLLTGVAAAAHEGWRSVQLLVLALPLLVWLRWPLQSTGWRRLRRVLASGLLLAFLADAAVRAFLWQQYQAFPHSSLVLAAVANTAPGEALEYLRHQGIGLVLGVLALLGLGGLCLLLVQRSSESPRPLSRGGRVLLIGLLLIAALAHASKPWRRHHPLLYWPAWIESAVALRSSWQNQDRERAQLLANAQQVAPRVLDEAPSTVVLVISDSVNRDNMSLYGYERETTPQLAALARQEGSRWLTLRHAWSAQANTVGSLAGFFSFGERGPASPAGQTQHVLALARAAGYHVWWMSNHDDVAIEQQHARLADEVEMINRQPGRTTSSLDRELLDCLDEALADPRPRKLIVLHLLGAHPHYESRTPPDERPFDAHRGDRVDQRLAQAGKPLWLRERRQSYDDAILHHDGVVAATLRQLQRQLPAGDQAAWMFVSDHGQEVGHELVHAGHSPHSAAGYRVPALLWRNGAPFPAEAAERPFRLDWGAWVLADLLRIDWSARPAQRNVLDPRYAWAPPELPLRHVRFDR